jgi:hypothetical protein
MSEPRSKIVHFAGGALFFVHPAVQTRSWGDHLKEHAANRMPARFSSVAAETLSGLSAIICRQFLATLMPKRHHSDCQVR